MVGTLSSELMTLWYIGWAATGISSFGMGGTNVHVLLGTHGGNESLRET